MPKSREAWLIEKFNQDGRAVLALEWLDGSRPQDVKGEAPTGETVDPEAVSKRTAKVNHSGHRTVTLGSGRGALLLHRQTCSPPVPVTVAPLTLSVRLYPSSLTCSPDLSTFPPETLYWPEFDNGVAAALELPAIHDVSREWVLKHVKVDLKRTSAVQELPELGAYRHAGLLFGLGLLGHFKLLRADDFYKILKPPTDQACISTLLGAAASSISLGKSTVAARLCFLHIPGLLLQCAADLEISGVVQSAAVVAAGLCCALTADRAAAEAFLGEIGRRPVAGDKVLVADSECYSLSAGFALGIVCLGKGGMMPKDIALDMRLLGLAGLGPVCSLPAAATANRTSTRLGDAATRSNLVWDGVMPNLTLTAPAALVAIGLCFWRTGHASLATALLPPQTLSELYSGPRPDILLLRSLSRCLVLWETIEPSGLDDLVALPHYLTSEGISGLQKREAGRQSDSDTPSKVDWLLLARARLFMQAGAALALGLKFAGTGNSAARATLLAFARKLVLDTRWSAPSSAARLASRSTCAVMPDKYTLETCRGVALVSLAMVCSGSGDLEILRLLRSSRRRSDENSTFASHWATHHSLGLLFLGGGRYTLSSGRPEAVACLLLSALPRYACHSADNSFVLHACRHLYAVAAVPKKNESEKENVQSSNAEVRIKSVLEALRPN